MISVDEAKSLITTHCLPLPSRRMHLSESAGLTLTAPVQAELDLPNYPQSSMDGYALRFEDMAAGAALTVRGTVAAGSREALTVGPGEVVRIFTGAAVPPGADTVVMQEKTELREGRLIISDPALTRGSNVRPLGAEIRSGEEALSAGTRLSPAALGFLAGIGIAHVNVYPPPSVCIIVTGNELQQSGEPLAYGQVYESNSVVLEAALRRYGVRQIRIQRVEDNTDTLRTALGQALAEADLVILTGGVSVGDYDFVPAAAAACGVQTIFHKIRQKPGKPIFFGKKEQTLVFGLPGNPASVLTCFYEYVTLALQGMFQVPTGIRSREVRLLKACRKTVGLTHFLKAIVEEDTVTPLDGQESYRMRSFARANCLLLFPEHMTSLEEGQWVTIHEFIT